MTYYKGTRFQKCINFLYEPEHTYTLETKPLEICKNGFHFCDSPDDVLEYYPIDYRLTLLEVEPLGTVIHKDNKYCTDKIKILRIIPRIEWSTLFKSCLIQATDNCIHLTYPSKCFQNYEEWYEHEGNTHVYRNNRGDIQRSILDDQGYILEYKDQTGYGFKKDIDNNGRCIHFKNSKGWEEWWTYDQYGYMESYHNSDGYSWNAKDGIKNMPLTK